MLLRSSLLVLSVIMASVSAPAMAEPASAAASSTAYVGATAEAGFDVMLRAGVGIEAGRRASKSGRLWLRGRITGGAFTPDQLGGKYLATAIGFEGHHCTRTEAACLIGGVDLGAVFLRWDPDHDVIVV